MIRAVGHWEPTPSCSGMTALISRLDSLSNGQFWEGGCPVVHSSVLTNTQGLHTHFFLGWVIFLGFYLEKPAANIYPTMSTIYQLFVCLLGI